MQHAYSFIKTYASGAKQHDVLVTVEYRRPKLISPEKRGADRHAVPLPAQEEHVTCDTAAE